MFGNSKIIIKRLDLIILLLRRIVEEPDAYHKSYKRSGRMKATQDKMDLALNLHEQGLSNTEVSEYMGLSYPTIVRYINIAKEELND